MVEGGGISKAQKKEALESKVALQERKKNSSPNLYFIDYILGQLEKTIWKGVCLFWWSENHYHPECGLSTTRSNSG